MATNNLLVNNEKKVLYDIQRRVERSAHNLSQSRKFPCEVGFIYPFFCRKTLPSDSFKIWSNILIKQLQPLLVPQMVSFTVNTAFYWVDYSLAFPDFEYFLINQKGSQNVELPYIKLRSVGTSNYLLPEISKSINDRNNKSAVPLFENLRTFLDITANNCNDKVDALPFWAYQTIIRDYYVNVDRLSDAEYISYFPENIHDHYLKQGVNTFYNSSSFDFDQIRAHNVRGDYFVNSYPTPLRGDIPTLSFDTSIGDLTADFYGVLNNVSSDTDELDLNQKEIFFDNPLNSTGNTSAYLTPETISVDGGSLNTFRMATQTGADSYSALKAVSQSVFPTGLPNKNVWASIENKINSINGHLARSAYNGNITLSNLSNFSTSVAVTARQLRLLESLTRKREIDVLMKPRLKNYLQTYFGVNRYKDDSLYQPVFIGSTTQQILINDIAQTTATSDSPLGRQGATAMSLGSGYVGEYYCRNYGCLLGLMYILPDYDYEPALPKEWLERTPDDFYNPEFAHLSMQPILNKEIFVSDDVDWNDQVLGYGGMYDNYRTSHNLVCGEFLNDNFQDIRQFAQVRRFGNSNKPEITTSFLNSYSAFDKSVFSVPRLPPFIAQCVARVEAVRPLPEIATPRDS